MADEAMAEETLRWFAGIDCGSAKHQACLLDGAGTVVGERAFAHGGAGLAALCDWLVSMAGDPGSVAVALEVPHGPVVDALLDRGFAVYAIHPKQLERLRDRISVAGAKDDRRDARVAAAGLRTDRPLFRRVLAGDPSVGPCCTDQREDAVVLPSPAFRRYGQTSGVQTPACGSGPRRRRSSRWPDAGPCASVARRRSPASTGRWWPRPGHGDCSRRLSA